MGPLLVSSGDATEICECERADRASMGPLLVSSGDCLQQQSIGSCEEDASMGPLLVSSGDPSPTGREGPDAQGFNGAAAGEQRRLLSGDSARWQKMLLQWGRCW